MAEGREGEAVRSRRLSTLAVVALPAMLGGCSLPYLLQLSYEEARILWGREPIAQVLAQPDLDAAVREKLELVLEAREFATQRLGLRADGSYTTLSRVRDRAVVHVLSAAPRTQLRLRTWWFPVVGRMPYKGFFDRAATEGEAERLESQGFDTLVRPAVAFSTLGWFNDPLLDTVLGHEPTGVIATVLHEICHSTYYRRGHTDFNESLATFAGHRGAIAFFAMRPGGEHMTTAARREWRETLALSRFYEELSGELRRLYESAALEAKILDRRTALFTSARSRLRALGFPAARGEAEGPLNNAVVLHRLLYLSKLDLFERAFHQHGGDLRDTLAWLWETAADADQPFAAIGAALGEVSAAEGGRENQIDACVFLQ